MLHHPNIREIMVIHTNGPVSMAIRGLNRATFGQITAKPDAHVDYDSPG